MVHTNGVPEDRQGALVEWLSFLVIAHVPIEPREVTQAGNNVRVFRAPRLFIDGYRPAVKRLRPKKPALARIEFRQIIENGCDVGMLRSESLLEDGKRSFVERFRIGQLSSI